MGEHGWASALQRFGGLVLPSHTTALWAHVNWYTPTERNSLWHLFGHDVENTQQRTQSMRCCVFCPGSLVRVCQCAIVQPCCDQNVWLLVPLLLF